MAATSEQIAEDRKVLLAKLDAFARAAKEVEDAQGQCEMNGDNEVANAMGGPDSDCYPFTEIGSMADVQEQIQAWAWKVEERLTGKSGAHP